MTEPDPGDPTAQLAEWIMRRRPELRQVAPDQELIDSRLVDSLALVELIGLIERLSGRPVDVETLDVEDLRSLNRIRECFFHDIDLGPQPAG